MHGRRIFLCLVGALLCGCGAGQAIYRSGSPPIPFLSHTGELVLTGSGEVGQTKFSGTSMIGAVSGAYAITNNIGLVAALSYSPIAERDSNGAGSFYTEAGAGYHRNYGVHGRAELYGGLGYGHVHNRSLVSFQRSFDPIPGIVNSTDFVEDEADYLRPFVQVNAGGEGSLLGYAFALRASYLIITNFDTHSVSWQNSYPDSSGKTSKLNTVQESRSRTYSGLFLEPAIVFRIGEAPLKMEAKAWGSVALGDPGFPWTMINGSLGVSVELDP